MPKYDLSQLGADEFERLVQSLLKTIIGPGTTTFGDGPDGAREATFLGHAPYPSQVDQWDGFWIFQVKYHDTSDRNYARKAVLDDLDKELDKVKNKYKHPVNNFIIATNVPLSSVHEKGTHDRLEAIANKYKDGMLRNVHWWGADEIMGFIDNSQDVRKAFHHLITSGDVLSDIMDRSPTISLRELSSVFSRVADTSYTQTDLDLILRAQKSGQISIIKDQSPSVVNKDAGTTLIVTEKNIVVRVIKSSEIELFSDELRDLFIQYLDDASPSFHSFEPMMVYIPPGPFLMGFPPGESVNRTEWLQHEVSLPGYCIGITPITNEQYSDFVNQTGFPVAPQSGWNGQLPPSDKLDNPVAGVTWYDALAYCKWLSTKTNKHYQIPSEAHWEKAARGIDGRYYPWGNEWDPKICNWGGREIKPVKNFPTQSIYGCYDMVGNVREWTRSLWGGKRSQPDVRYRYPWVNDSRNLETANKQIRRVLRGGAYLDKPDGLTCYSRYSCLPERSGITDNLVGFRVMMKL